MQLFKPFPTGEGTVCCDTQQTPLSSNQRSVKFNLWPIYLSFYFFPSPPLTQFFLDCSGLVRTDKKPALCKSYQKLISELWHKKR